jgi:hypothetical protein
LPLAAACAVIAVAFVLNTPQEASRPSAGETQFGVESLEPEQIERAAEDVEMLRLFSTPGPGQAL